MERNERAKYVNTEIIPFLDALVHGNGTLEFYQKWARSILLNLPKGEK